MIKEHPTKINMLDNVKSISAPESDCVDFTIEIK